MMLATMAADRADAPPRFAASALLLLADGRFPAGGHAHPGGLEAAAATGGVRDLADLEAFLRGRAATAGMVAAAFAAAAQAAAGADGGERGIARLAELDRELDARMPSPALRGVSRRLGRQMMRAGRIVWPHALLDQLAAAEPRGLHQPVVLGAVAAAARLGAADAAAAAMHEAVTAPATAAVRLLGFDPFAVHAVLARLGPALDALIAEAAAHAEMPAADLPACGSPMLDLLAELHARWEVRLFGS